MTMSFLHELTKKKENLKSCQTIVTTLDGSKYLEKKSVETGKTEKSKLPETCPGFVVDAKLDLQIAEILDYLCLSSQDVAQDIGLLRKNKITHVLSVGVDLPTPEGASEIKFKKVELLDEPNTDILKVLNSCFEYIDNCRLENETNKVLVHCNAGYSRAPTVVIAYLMIKLNYSLEESFKRVKEKRNIKPNDGFMMQLKNLKRKV